MKVMRVVDGSMAAMEATRGPESRRRAGDEIFIPSRCGRRPGTSDFFFQINETAREGDGRSAGHVWIDAGEGDERKKGSGPRIGRD